MSGQQWLIVLAVALITALAVYFVYRHRRRLALDLAALTEAERGLHAECVAADRALAKAEATHKARVSAARKDLKCAQSVEVLAQVGGNSVTALEVRMNGKARPISPEITVGYDTEGDLQSFIHSGEHKATLYKADAREHYVMVTGPGWAEVVKVDGGKSESVYQFVLALQQAVENLPTFVAQHAAAIAEATRHLDEVEGDTTEVDAARVAREAMGPDPLKQLREQRRAARTR